jgi:hydroxymethylpyrimidine pyrophosphatase-like HAD family hydrolase
VCIVSSKDFEFLHAKTKFANVSSCIMGIETIVLKKHKQEAQVARNNYGFMCENNLECIESKRLLSNKKTLEVNSSLLVSIANYISQNFNQSITLEQKFTADKRILAGITIDWRHMKDWQSFKLESEPHLRKLISEKQRELSINGKLHIQTYTTHPFIDMYATKCDKGIAFDYVYHEILKMQGKQEQQQNILYLGDSENDNPAFRKADVSIGVHSDTRLKPKLNCKYNVCFDKLSAFFKGLLNEDLHFSDNLVTLL